MPISGGASTSPACNTAWPRLMSEPMGLMSSPGLAAACTQAMPVTRKWRGSIASAKRLDTPSVRDSTQASSAYQSTLCDLYAVLHDSQATNKCGLGYAHAIRACSCTQHLAVCENHKYQQFFQPLLLAKGKALQSVFSCAAVMNLRQHHSLLPLFAVVSVDLNCELQLLLCLLFASIP